MFSLSGYLSGTYYKPYFKSFTKEKWMGKDEFHVHKRRMWSDVQLFFKILTI